MCWIVVMVWRRSVKVTLSESRSTPVRPLNYCIDLTRILRSFCIHRLPFRVKSVVWYQWKCDTRSTTCIASKHFVCGTCSSWVDFDTSGCTNSWAEIRGGTCVFACKGCREVAMLVGEVEELRQMMENMKRIVTGQGLEEKGEETGNW